MNQEITNLGNLAAVSSSMNARVEAGCKSLYQVRFKRPGCRWKEETGAHLVELRALALSNRFDQALTYALAPLRHQVTPTLAPSAALSCAA